MLLEAALGKWTLSLVTTAVIKGSGALAKHPVGEFLRKRSVRKSLITAFDAAWKTIRADHPVFWTQVSKDPALRARLAPELGKLALLGQEPDIDAMVAALRDQPQLSEEDYRSAVGQLLFQIHQRLRADRNFRDYWRDDQFLLIAPMAAQVVALTQAFTPPPVGPQPWSIVTDQLDAAERFYADQLPAEPRIRIRREVLELALQSAVREAEGGAVALLGAPGSGKSDLLKRAGAQAAAEGMAVIYLRAETLSSEVRSLAEIETALGLGATLDAVLTQIGHRGQRALLIIDQMDALLDLVDQTGFRLHAVFEAIRTVTGHSGATVLFACRRFEWEHDPRVKKLEPTIVEAADPTWGDLKEDLDAAKVRTDHWAEPMQELMRRPQHLRLYLETLGGVGDFSTIQALIEAVLRERVLKVKDLGSAGEAALQGLANLMAESEQLHAPRAALEIDHDPQLIERLEATGLIRAQGPQLAFEHQSLFDHLRARRFVAGGLADWVLGGRQSLVVRPQIWASLAYMRAAAPYIYGRELETLLAAPALRPHLRRRIHELIAAQEGPSARELHLVKAALGEPEGLDLLSWVSDPAWLPGLETVVERMARTGDDQLNFRAAEFLAGMLAHEQARDRALSAIRRLWLEETSRPALIAWALGYCRRPGLWSAEVTALAVEVADLGGERMDMMVQSALRDNASAAARQIFIVNLGRRVAAGEQVFSDYRVKSDLEGVARLDPAAVLPSAFALIVASVARHPERKHSAGFLRAPRTLRRYDREHGIGPTIDDIIDRAAVADPEAFGAWLSSAMDAPTGIDAVESWLARAVGLCAEARPDLALRFWREDPRRLSELAEDHGAGEALCNALIATGTALSADQAEPLIAAVCAAARYPDPMDSAREPLRVEVNDQHRLDLLRLLPHELLGVRGRAEFDHLTALYQDHVSVPVRYRAPMVSWVGSPVSRAEMAGLPEDALVGIFQDLTDDKVWLGPTSTAPSRGGSSLQASRELAEMAKMQPERASALLARFEPNRQESPAGMVLRALAELPEFSTNKVLDHIDDLLERGFASEGFRDEVTEALRTVAIRGGGLADRHIELITSWLVPFDAPSHESSLWADDDEAASEAPEVTPAIFQDHVSGAIEGNTFQLTAILEGYRHRSPTDRDGAIRFLNRHLDFPEDPRIWRHLARFDLVELAYQPGAETDAFFARLYAERRDDLGFRAATSLLGFLYRFRPIEWVMAEARRLAAHDRSAERAHWAGELLGLLAVTQVGGTEASQLLEQAILDPELACAVQARRGSALATFEALAATAEGDFNGVSERALTQFQRLAALAGPGDAQGADLPSVFFKVSGSDQRAGRILQILMDHPLTLDAPHGMNFLLDRVSDGFGAGVLPERTVMALLEVVHAQNVSRVGDITQSFAAEAGDLVALLVTLTRSTDQEVYGRALHLFERLLSDRVHAATAAARTADNPFFRT